MPEPLREHNIPSRPRLKPWYRLSESDDGVVLRYGGSVLEFAGAAARRLLPRLLPLLDGTRGVDELSVELGEAARPAVENALRVLAEQRLLAGPAPTELDSDAARTVELLAATDPYGVAEARDTAAALAAARVAVIGWSGVGSRIVELLESVSDVSRPDWTDEVDCDLAIVAPAPEELPLVDDWNLVALERGIEWLPVLPFDGQLAAVGPLVVPHESACYECYRRRRSAAVSPVPDTAVGAYPSAPALDSVLAGYATVVALRRLGIGDGRMVGVLLAIEQSPELGCSRHAVHRVPRCLVCSPAATTAVPSPWSGVHRVAA